MTVAEGEVPNPMLKGTLSSSTLYKYADRPYFQEGVIGMFVRVSTAKGYRVMEIVDVSPLDELVKWRSKYVGIRLQCRGGSDDGPEKIVAVDLPCVSGSKPNAEEFEQFRRRRGGYLPTEEEVESLRHTFDTQVARRVLSDNEVQPLVEYRCKLGITGNNLVKERSLLEREISSNQLDPSAAEALAEQNAKKFYGVVESRSEDLDALAAITLRNLEQTRKLMNKKRIVSGEGVIYMGDNWEFNDTERARLAKEFDDREKGTTDDAAEEGQKKVVAATTDDSDSVRRRDRVQKLLQLKRTTVADAIRNIPSDVLRAPKIPGVEEPWTTSVHLRAMMS